MEVVGCQVRDDESDRRLKREYVCSPHIISCV